MVDSSKIAERASTLAGQAVQAAGPAFNRAKGVAGGVVGQLTSVPSRLKRIVGR